MLGELHISNFAVIKDLSLRFVPGLNVISGEEGTGKSLLVDALGLLMGSRAPSGLIRSGTKSARVEAIFWPSEDTLFRLRETFEQCGIEIEQGGMVLITRDFQDGGRSIARVNNRAVPLSVLRQLGHYLVDIHGQMEYLSLLDAANQLSLVDIYGNLVAARRELRMIVEEWRQKERALENMTVIQREGYAELLKFQIEEIEKAKLEEINEEELCSERDILRRAEAVNSSCLEAYNCLYGDDNSISVQVHRMLNGLRAIGSLDKTICACREKLENGLLEVEVVAQELRAYAEKIENSQERLEELEQKIEILRTMKRKYGKTIQEILAFKETAMAELDALLGRQQKLATLETERQEQKAMAGKKAEALSLARRRAAGNLVKLVNTELAEIGLEWAKFDIQISRREDEGGVVTGGGKVYACTVDGIDRLDFQVATNPGEPMRLMSAIASGGETSRIVLAVKSALKAADPIPTLVFDEIDMGVGGRSADSVGRKLSSLAGFHQVLCITHLPQIACFGDLHFKLVKEIDSGRAASRVEVVEGPEKVRELAAMLGTERNGNAMLRSAEALIRNAERWKAEAREPVSV